MTLYPCYWMRVECGCGSYDVADTERVDGEVACVKCKRMARVTTVLIGRTTREMPYVSPVAPKFDVGGMVMNTSSIERGYRSGGKAQREKVMNAR